MSFDKDKYRQLLTEQMTVIHKVKIKEGCKKMKEEETVEDNVSECGDGDYKEESEKVIEALSSEQQEKIIGVALGACQKNCGKKFAGRW